MIELDGSHGEGGGSIIRQALALSVITGKGFIIENIRIGRKNPGLAPQHLAAINAAKDLCNAKVSGHYIGSTVVKFEPGEIKGGKRTIDIGTAGSVTLMLQSVLLPSIFSGKKISFVIKGGTDVKWSQPFDYFKHVFIPQMRRYANIEANLFRRGYYPKGGGEIRISISPKESNPGNPAILLLDQQKLLMIRGLSHASVNLESSQVAERQAKSAMLYLEKLRAPFSIKHEYSNTPSTGSGITLWAVFGEDEIDQVNPVILGADALGGTGKKAEIVGKESAEKLAEIIESGAAVDEFLADQLIPVLAIVGGIIKTKEVTDHVKSNIYVAEKFTSAKFSVQNNIISCGN